MKSTKIPGNSSPMSKVLVYLISGEAGVGKTFSKSVLQDMYTEAGYRVVALPFAKKVKDVPTLS